MRQKTKKDFLLWSSFLNFIACVLIAMHYSNRIYNSGMDVCIKTKKRCEYDTDEVPALA